MDRFNARLVSTIAEILTEIDLEDAQEQCELNAIARRLKELSVGTADDLCCERIRRELSDLQPAKLAKKRLQ